MARSARLLRLLHAMRTMAAPITAARLAEETGVSPRSLYRDIDALRAAGAQIEGERGYGYRLIEDVALPPQTLDEAEIEALALGMAEVRALGDPVLADAAQSVLAKVAAILPDARERQLVHAIAQIFRPEPRYVDMIDLAPLREACWREQALHLVYADRDGRPSERVVWPLALVYSDSCVTVLAWCRLREDFRMFRSDRIVGIGRGDESFRPRRVALLRDYVGRLQAAREERLRDGSVRDGGIRDATDALRPGFPGPMPEPHGSPGRVKMETPMTAEAEIEEHEERLRRAMLAGDLDALDRLLDDDVIYTGPDGGRIGKREDIDAHRSGLLRLERIDRSAPILVRVLGDTAIVGVRLELAGSYAGQAFAGTFAYTRVWHRSGARWWVVAAHSSAISATDMAPT